MPERDVTGSRLPVLDIEPLRNGLEILDPPTRRVVPHPAEDFGRRGHGAIVSMVILQIKGGRQNPMYLFCVQFPGVVIGGETYYRVEVLWKSAYKRGIILIKTDKFGELACL